MKGVYQIVCKTTGKRYVGSTWGKGGFSSRWLTHTKNLNGQCHTSPHFQNAWNKYGEDSFLFQILEVAEDREECIKIEQQYFDVMDKNLLLNGKYQAVGVSHWTGKKRGPRTDDEKKRISDGMKTIWQQRYAEKEV